MVQLSWNLAHGDKKQKQGTRYGTHWEMPQKRAIAKGTAPYHAMKKKQFVVIRAATTNLQN